MTRQDIIKKTQVKMDSVDSNDDYYKDYYNPLIDEALSVIANTVLPYQNQIIVKYFDKLSPNELSEGDIGYYKDVTNNQWVTFNSKGEYETQPVDSLGVKIKIPSDLMSFSDESLIRYVDSKGNITMNAPVLYLDRYTLALPKDGSYTIAYNSEYPSIKTVKENEEISWLPRNVGNIIPSYVASQLYASEDMTRSVLYKNEFETMLARLDDNKVLPSYNIENTSGWTL